MKLINTDGLAFIGPGSEWFWTMVTMIVLTITFVAIYRQLRVQGTANALQKMQFLLEGWESDRLTHARVTIALHLKYEPPGEGMEPAMVVLADFFETVSDLADGGHLSRTDVHYLLGRSLQMWWALMSPAIAAESVRQRRPMYGGWGQLNQAERMLDAKEGYPYQLDATTLPQILDDMIRINTGRLRLAKDVKSGIIPTAPKRATAS